LVYPSLYEGFGFPILEAQSQGCVVVAAQNSCLPEIGGDGAMYFPDNDAATLAARVREILRNGDEARELREMGYKNVSRFSWNTAALETLRVLEQTVRGDRARSAKRP
jgi:glycosyltransferase involved in cell wall biosynthesis